LQELLNDPSMRLLFLFLLVSTALCADPEYPKMGPDIYDIHADGARQIGAALAQARAGNKRVLVEFGANWCIWCRRLHNTMESDPAVSAKLADSFVVVLIDVNRHHGPARNPDLILKYGNPVRLGIPVLLVLDADGRLLTTEDSGNLEEGDHHSPRKILEFLGQWSAKASPSA
jgi:thiol-disulfide isomerase/thioredoxin